jgi:acetylglutamate kinase
MRNPIVLKIGGNDLDQPGFVEALARTVAQSDSPLVIVHGGGKEISQMQHQMGITPRYVEGLRVSDEASLSIAQMVLCGTVNTRIVLAMQLYGVNAQGMNGMDQGLIRARKLHHPAGDLGRVGEVYRVEHKVLRALLLQGITPVIAPICLGDDGPFNVNADHVAGAVARSIRAEKVVFLTNVRGVLDNGNLVHTLDAEKASELVAKGTIHGGMLPKVETALHLVGLGVRQVMITDLEGVRHGVGTSVVSRATAQLRRATA